MSGVKQKVLYTVYIPLGSVPGAVILQVKTLQDGVSDLLSFKWSRTATRGCLFCKRGHKCGYHPRRMKHGLQQKAVRRVRTQS